MKPKIFTTGNKSERITALPVTRLPYRLFTLYSLKLSGVKKGDVIHALAYGEVSNRVGYNVMVAYNLQLATGPKPEDKIDEITERRGTNVDPTMHHFEPYDGDYYTFKQDFSQVYVNFVVNSASDHPVRKDTDTLKVESDYGRLTVALYADNIN